MSQSCKTGLVCRRELHILNLGAGVQSTAVYLLSREPEYRLRFDYAIFADTGDEPQAVYDHLAWLMSLKHTTILVRSAGNLGDALLRGENSTGQKFVTVPAYTAPNENGRGEKFKEGRVRRQCTKEYKIDVVERAIRRELLGVKPRCHVPKNVRVHQYFGISLDEAGRAERAKKRFGEMYWTEPHYPLIDMGWSRKDCLKWLEGKVPHPVPRSACVYCPFHSNAEWAALKAAGGADWERAVEIDEGLRKPGVVVNRGMDQQLYLHRKCLPLQVIDFAALEADRLSQFQTQECEGMCGL